MRFVADFQSLDDEDGLVVTFDDLLDVDAVAVSVGSRVALDDLEGNTAMARVKAVQDGILDLKVDLTTWMSSHVSLDGWTPSRQDFRMGWQPMAQSA